MRPIASNTLLKTFLQNPRVGTKILVGLVLLLSLGTNSLSGHSPFSTVNAAALPSHDPISIKSNADFTAAKGVTGGTGTVGDPYVIQGWDIDLSCQQCVINGGIPDGIRIESTTAHFVISNVDIHDGITGTGVLQYDGIFFSGVQNGIVKDSILKSDTIGINVDHSSNNVFSGNQLLSDGIPAALSLSSYNTFLSNTASNPAAYSFQVTDSSDNTFVQNQVSGGVGGFLVVSIASLTTRNTFAYNTVVTVSLKGFDGFLLQSAPGNTLEYNTVTYAGGLCVNSMVFTCPDGFHLESSNNNVLIGNVAADNPNDGFLLELGSTGNLLRGNIAHGSTPVILGNAPLVGLGAGFACFAANGNTFVSNIAYLNDAGFDLSLSNHNRFSSNIAHDNGDGFDLFDDSILNVFDHNQVYGSINWGGFYLDSFDGNGVDSNTLAYNIAHDNVAGFRLGAILTGVNNNTLLGNLAYSNNVPGALSSLGVTLGPGTGIILDGATNTKVVSNIVFNNQVGISTSGTALGGGQAAIVNNFLSNTQNAVEGASGDVYNVAKTATSNGNIIGGPYLGGNFWSDYTGSDADGDGIGDTPYSLYVNLGGTLFLVGQDNLPLVFGPATGTTPYFDIIHGSSLTVDQGTNATIPFAFVSRNGYSDTIALTATISPTSNSAPRISFEPSTVTVPARGINATAVSAANTMTPGIYSIQITATSTTFTTTTITIPLTINPIVKHTPTATSVICTPSNVVVNLATSCVATVTDLDKASTATPTGTVTFTPGSGTCTLAGTGGSASCPVTVTPTATGTLSVSASYPGDTGHDGSIGTTSITVVSKITTTTKVVCPTTDTLSVAVTCTATITDTTSGSTNTPSGTVSFTTGSVGTFIGSPCTLAGSGSAASCSVQYTPNIAGSHLVTGSYAGDTTHVSSSGSATITIGKNPTSTSIACALVTVGQASICTVTVTDTSASGATTPTGTVMVTSAGTCALSGTSVSTSCSVSITHSSAGTFTITASYSGDATHGTSTGQATLTVTRRATSTSVTCSPASIIVGSATTCTATVTDTSPGTPTTPTGTVAFTSSSTASAFTSSPCTLSGSGGASATCQVTYTSASSAPHSDIVLGSYSGDTSHASSSNTFQVHVTALQTHSTLTTVSCIPSPVFVGQPIQCSAAVADTSSTSSSPTGVVTFTPGGSCTLSGTGPSTTCSITTTPMSPGTITVAASYSGDSTSTPHSGSSGSTTVTVNPVNTNLRTTTTIVACTPATILILQATNCTATVTDTDITGTPSTPTGTITLTTGGTCSLTGTGPSSSCSVTLTPTATGTLTVSADYPGDAGHRSSSGGSNLTVGKRPTITAVICSPSTILIGQASACTVTAVDNAGTTTTTVKPTGTITFTPGGASCTLVNTGTATTCSANFTPTGYGTITVSADYAGDTYHTGSTGTATVTVNQQPKPTTTTTVACTPSTLQVDHSASCTATVVDTSSNPTHPSGTVSFISNGQGSFGSQASCTLQPGSGIGASSCSVTYAPSSVGGGTQTVTASYGGDSMHAQTQGTTSLTVQSPTGSGTPSPNSNTPGNSGAQQPLLNGLLLPALVASIAAVGSAAAILLRLRSIKRTQGRP